HRSGQTRSGRSLPEKRGQERRIRDHGVPDSLRDHYRKNQTEGPFRTHRNRANDRRQPAPKPPEIHGIHGPAEHQPGGAEPVATGHHRRRRDRIPFAGSHPQKASQPEYPSHRQQSRLQLLPPPVPFRHLPGYHPHPLVPELKSPYKTPHALPAPSPRWGGHRTDLPPKSTALPQPQRLPSLLLFPATSPRRGGPPNRPPSEIDRPTVAPASHSFLFSSLLLSSPLFPDQSDGG